MRTQIRRALFIIRESWSFLGCEGGSARWRARRQYAVGIVPVTIRFLWVCRHDEEGDWA